MVIYKPGDVIQECQPLVHVLNDENRGKRCDYCLKLSLSLMRCSKCKLVQYCGKECQKKDWRNAHKFKECEFFSKHGDTNVGLTTQDFRFLLRYALKLKFHPTLSEKKFKIYDGRTRKVHQLKSNSEHFKKNKLAVTCIAKIAEKLTNFGCAYETDDLIELLGHIQTNSFAISPAYFEMYYATSHANFETVLNEDPGNGLYIEASIFNHSCKPNACRNFRGLTMQIRALDVIDTDKEEVTLHYVIVVKSRKQRQEFLLRNHHFKCMCERCTSELDDQYCLEYNENRIMMSNFERVGNYVVACKAAEKSYAANVKMLGKYSASGLEALLGITDNIEKSFRFGKNKCLKDFAQLEQLLATLKETVRVVHGTDLNYYNKAIESFASFISSFKTK